MKKIFLTLALTVVALAVSAIPAKPGIIRTLMLSDGTTVKAQLVGDEHGHYWLTQPLLCDLQGAGPPLTV